MSTLRDLRRVSDGIPRGVRRLLTSLLAALPLTLMFAVFVSAAAGDLDPTFDGDGKVVTDLGASEAGRSMAIQADGKIVVAGGRGVPGANDFALTRYDPDGSLDATFGGAGWVVTDLDGGNELISAVAIQPDGKIVVTGSRFLSGGSDFALARYDPVDGSLDSTFGVGGWVLIDFGGFDEAFSLAIQESDGKIVVAGSRFLSNALDFAVARYNADGSPDLTFSGDGKVVTDFGANDWATAVAIQNGKIVAAGVRAQLKVEVALARYDPSDGSLDSTFGASGKLVTDLGASGTTDLAIQSDGKIVVSAFGDNFILARFNSIDGSPDSTFGVGGKAVTDFGSRDTVSALAIQADGNIVAAGSSNVRVGTSDAAKFALARYVPNGSLDPSFGSGGKVLTDFRVEGSPGVMSAFAGAAAVAMQADGNIVAAGGGFTGEGGTTDIMLARYLGAGNTPAGTNVGVQIGDVALTFQNVIQAGDTTVTTSSTGPQPPEGFSLGNPPTYFDITTTAVFSGSIEVCITYTGIAFDNEAALQLLHFDGTAWVDVTTSLDTVNDVICGSVTSFSLFIIGEPSFVPADVAVDPSTINKKAKGSYITVYIEFAEGTANPADIDVSTVTLSALGFTAHVPSGSPTAVGDGNGNGVVDVMVKFDRATVQSWFAGPATAVVRVAGRFVNGTGFQGEDAIVMIDEGAEHTNESDPRSVRR